MKLTLLVVTLMGSVSFAQGVEKNQEETPSRCEVINQEIEAEAQRRTLIALINTLPETSEEFEKTAQEKQEKLYQQYYEQVAEERKLDLNKHCQ